MKNIICALEPWDSVIDYYRPNGSSKTWGLHELGKLTPPPTLYDWMLKEIIKSPKQDASELILPSFSKRVKIVKYDDIQSYNKYFYFIYIHDPNYFKKNNELGFKGISEQYIQDVRSDKCKIVFSLLNEGYSGSNSGDYQDDFLKIDNWCSEVDIPHRNVYYITSNLIGDKIGKNQNIKINIIPLTIQENPEGVLNFGGNVVEYKPTDEKCIFLSYSRRTREHRILFILKLFEHKLNNVGRWSYNSLDINPRDFIGDEILNQNPEYGKYLDFLHENSPILIDVDNTDNRIVEKHLPIDDYEKTFISVVGETLSNKNTLFVSEKTWKPIIMGHPFIINGCAGTLNYLRNEGFMTFGEWIDESYDNEENHIKRIDMIINELKKINNKSTSELFKIRKEMREICNYNKTILLRRVIGKFYYEGGEFSITKPIEDVLSNILDNWGGEEENQIFKIEDEIKNDVELNGLSENHNVESKRVENHDIESEITPNEIHNEEKDTSDSIGNNNKLKRLI